MPGGYFNSEILMEIGQTAILVEIATLNSWESRRRIQMVALAISLNGPAKFVTWGVISISVPNLIMIGLIVVFFVLALVIPFPSHKKNGE